MQIVYRLRMTTKRTHDEFKSRREIQDSGWKLEQTDKVEFNSGSETVKHVVGKSLVAKVLKDRGYRIDSEVEKDGVGEIDIVAYGKDNDAFGVELETSPTEEVVSDKIERYCYGEIWRDVFVLNLNEMPVDMLEAKSWIENQL